VRLRAPGRASGARSSLLGSWRLSVGVRLLFHVKQIYRVFPYIDLRPMATTGCGEKINIMLM